MAPATTARFAWRRYWPLSGMRARSTSPTPRIMDISCQPKIGDVMTNISATNKVVTFITVYEVAPAEQQHLIDLITTAYEQTIRHLSGFVEAHTHRSSDGVRVVTYAQWDGQLDVEAMLRNSDLWPIFI